MTLMLIVISGVFGRVINFARPGAGFSATTSLSEEF